MTLRYLLRWGGARCCNSLISTAPPPPFIGGVCGGGARTTVVQEYDDNLQGVKRSFHLTDTLFTGAGSTAHKRGRLKWQAIKDKRHRDRGGNRKFKILLLDSGWFPDEIIKPRNHLD